MFKYFFLLVLCGPLFQFVQAQSMADSLQEVVVYGFPQEKYATGSNIEHFDSLELARQQSRSLSDFLMRKSPVYFKEYGPGMLSTVSFRGTSANHTAVLWNGLNLNQPNLGQTDFSLIPLFVTEDISLQYGGNSALNGSDAIGGTIYLQSKPRWENQLDLKLRQEVGSFGRFFTGLAAKGGFKDWSFTSKVYHQQAENDFEYINTNKRSRPLEHNRNARFEQKGLVQDLAYRFNNSSSLSLKSWYQHTDRQIQPTMGDAGSKDQQEDENLNLSLQYKHNSASGFFDLQLGHLYNYLLYNKGSEFKTRQYIGNFRYEKALFKPLHLQVGAKLNHIEAEIASYTGGYATENRSDLFASFRYQPFPKFKSSLNLRQAFVTGFAVPFTPSAGIEYELLNTNTHNFKWLAGGGRNFRVPSLNDRYWEYAGDPELKPENAWNSESSLQYQFSRPGSRLEFSATAFSLWVKNWILWVPSVVPGPEGAPFSTWVPKNIQEVNSKGVELSGSAMQTFAFGQLELGGNLAYTRSVNQKARHAYDRTLNRQLPFVPQWKANAQLQYQLKGWSLLSNWTYTGIRYTTGEEAPEFSVPAFQLFDTMLGKNFRLNKHSLDLRMEVRNLLDKPYQNYENRAMPGRSYHLKINYHFTQAL